MVAQSPYYSKYEESRRLADAGRHAEALAAVQEYLLHEPQDGQAHNDAGALLYAMGRYDEAAESLRLAVGYLADGASHSLANLAEAYLASGRPSDVVPLLDPMARLKVLTADLANRTAASLLDGGDAGGAIEALIHSFRVSPRQDSLLPIYERVRSVRPKVAFFCEFPDTKFLRDIYAFVNARFEARLWSGQNREEMFRLLQWCDVAWMEWCTNQVVMASQLPKVCRTIVRLHRFEAFLPFPEKVQWEKIDALVTVGNPTLVEFLKRKIPDLERRTRVVPIPNGVDLDKFTFLSRPRGKNLACLGYVNMRKNPMLLLQGFQKLHALDPEYRLFFAGNFQDDGMMEEYLRYAVREMDIEGAVTFDGWQDDAAAWLEDKHYLVSASIGEGHPVGILEGMARGLKPVVHVFPGCREFFPPAYLWRTVDEFCAKVLADDYRPEEYRDYVAKHFPLKAQLDRVHDLFRAFERNPVSKQAASAATSAASAVDRSHAGLLGT